MEPRWGLGTRVGRGLKMSIDAKTSCSAGLIRLDQCFGQPDCSPDPGVEVTEGQLD